MDLDTLWFLLLVAFFVLRALRSGRSTTKNEPSRPAGEPAADTTGGLPFGFDGVLGEIREAIEQASAQQDEDAEGIEAASTLDETPAEQGASGWSELPPVSGGHGQHGRDDAFHDEEAFEEAAIGVGLPGRPVTDEEAFAYDDDYSFQSLEEAAGTPPITEGSIVGADTTVRRPVQQSATAASSVLGQLRTRTDARRAILLSEVLGPPRSKRPFER